MRTKVGGRGKTFYSNNKMRAGKIKKKILIILLSGTAIGLTHSPKMQLRVLKEAFREWGKINEEYLNRAINNLYKSNLVSYKEKSDGTITLILSKEGKKEALKYNLDKISLKKPGVWDKKWRIVTFDIPVRHNKARDALRFHIKRLGFYEYQKSIFVTPYPCEKEIEFISEFFRVKPFVRIITAIKLDNEIHLKKHFGL